MAKKFGKFLLFTAAVGTAAAAAYYFVHKKDSDMELFQDDDDYDDFCDDLDDDTDASSRNYVPLSRGDEGATDFTPLAEQIAQTTEEDTQETIEEFFDEDDITEEEPSIQDN